jgi:hypothetical protein
VYVQVALTELAQEFDEAADEAERSGLRREETVRMSHRKTSRSAGAPAGRF